MIHSPKNITDGARELRELLNSEFPEATLRVRPLAESVYITGYVPRPEMVDEILNLSRDYYAKVINGITVGGQQLVIMAGPCAVEGRDQLLETAHAVKEAGVRILRGGAYKPRTSPYSFQGLGASDPALMG